MERKCSKCDVVKPLDEFHRSPKGKYGRSAECKECRKEYDAQRYQNNREKILEHRKAFFLLFTLLLKLLKL